MQLFLTVLHFHDLFFAQHVQSKFDDICIYILLKICSYARTISVRQLTQFLKSNEET